VAAVIGLLMTGLLVAAIVLLWGKVDNLGDDVGQTRERVTDARGLSASLHTLEQSVADLQASVNTLTASTGAASTATTDVKAQLVLLQARTEALTACVNTYMDAIGGWTRNSASAVVYATC
jgi:hypothetical protein